MAQRLSQTLTFSLLDVEVEPLRYSEQVVILSLNKIYLIHSVLDITVHGIIHIISC